MHAVGERHLKDMDEPERVFELAIEGVAVAEEEPRGGPETPESPQGPSVSLVRKT